MIPDHDHDHDHDRDCDHAHHPDRDRDNPTPHLERVDHGRDELAAARVGDAAEEGPDCARLLQIPRVLAVRAGVVEVGERELEPTEVAAPPPPPPPPPPARPAPPPVHPPTTTHPR